MEVSLSPTNHTMETTKTYYIVRLGPAPRDYLRFETYEEAWKCSEHFRTEHNKTVCVEQVN